MQFFEEIRSFTSQEKNTFTNLQKKQISSFYTICNILYKNYRNTLTPRQPIGKFPKPLSDTLLKTVLYNRPRFAFGAGHTLFLQGTSVQACGDNLRGQLGLGDQITRTAFEPLNLEALTLKTLPFEDLYIIDVSCGEAFTVLLNKSGTLFVFGANFGNQSDIKNHTTTSPVSLTLKSNQSTSDIERGKKVSCGYEHTVILTHTNNVWVFGSNEYNQLGLDNQNQKKYYLPHKLDNLTTQDHIIDIACGFYHTAILSQSGEVFLFGQNHFGQLGKGNQGDCSATPVKLDLMGNHEKIIAVSCGARHTVVLTQSGKVFGFGCNGEGQIGLENDTNYPTPVPIPIPDDKKATAINCGAYHTLALTQYGLYATGLNEHGQLGVGDTNNRSKMTPVKTNVQGIHTIGAGFESSYFITNNEEMFLCGNNEFSQLGLNNELSRNEFALFEKKPFR